MLRWVILAFVVIALTATATLVVQYMPGSGSELKLPATSHSQGPQPKVVVEGILTHQFGTMSQQSTGSHSWKVKNEGAADLEIWMESSTCMCTIAKFKEGKKAVLKPGEDTQIELEWKTNNSDGDYTKGATIGTNDPERPSFQLQVHGKVYPPVVILPSGEVVQVATVPNDETRTTSVAVFSPNRPEMKLTKITTSKPDNIVARPEPMTPEDLLKLNLKGGFRLNIDIKPGLALGTFREEVVAQTDHPLRPEIRLLVTGTVVGPISVVPDRLRMVTVKSREGATGQITLLVRGGRPTEFEVTHKPEKVQVSIAADETSNVKGRYRLTVKIPPGTTSGLIDDQIILKTNHPKAGELKIPLHILVGAS